MNIGKEFMERWIATFNDDELTSWELSQTNTNTANMVNALALSTFTINLARRVEALEDKLHTLETKEDNNE